MMKPIQQGLLGHLVICSRNMHIVEYSPKFSDAYSFGVLLLEIVSGKKNSSFYDEDDRLFLTAYAWKLWNEGKILSLMDPAIYDSGMEDDIVRCKCRSLMCARNSSR